MEVPGEVFGTEAWQQLIDQLIGSLGKFMNFEYRPGIDEQIDEGQLREFPFLWKQLRQTRQAYDRFLRAIWRSSIRKLERFKTGEVSRCLFISHRQCDQGIARRVACIAQEHGYDYWLDVEDPNLTAISTIGGIIPATVKAVLVAATIEIGLLNSTHVIALLSKKAKGSQWIPYEYGRAKAYPAYSKHPLWTPTAATWVQSDVNPPEHALLATILRTELGLRRWLATDRTPHNCEVQTRRASLDGYFE